MSAPVGQLSFGTKLSFGIGQVAEGIKNNGFALFLLFYYVQVLGLSASLGGFALFIALLFDAVSDPIAGYVSDSWRSRWGRRHPFMYASAIPLALAFYLVFSPPAGLGEWGLFAWLTVFTVLTRAAMTLYHVPHIALGAEMSEDYEERTAIVSYRTAFGIGGALLVTLSVLVFFPETPEGVRGQLIGGNYAPFAVVAGVIMWVTIWMSAIGTHHLIPQLPRPADDRPPFRLSSVFEETALGLQNPNFRPLFLGVLISFVMVGVNVGLNLFMFTFFWELTAAQLQLVLVAYPLGILAGTPLTRLLHRRFEKKPVVVAGTAWWAVLQLGPPVLRLLDLFPANGTALLVGLLVGVTFVQGAGVVQGVVSFGSMVADIVDEHELRTGRRQEGIFFGATSFAGKATSGLGGLFAGFGLDLINWPRGPEIQTAADVPPETLVHLGLLFGPGVAVFGGLAVWLYTRFDLSRERHAQILAELRARRAARAGSSEAATGA